MGWIKTLPSGRVQAVYRDPAGRQRSRTFRIKRDAREWLSKVDTAVSEGTWIDPNGPKTPFKEWAEEWLDAHAGQPSTKAKCRSFLDTHIIPEFGKKPLGAITRIAVQGWVNGLSLAPSSVRSVYQTFAAVMNAAVEEGLLVVSPCRRITMPTAARGVNVYLTPPEVHALADQVPERYQALVLTTAYTGLRWGEVAGLPVRALDLLRGHLDVDQVLTRSGLRPYPKTKASRRRVALDEETVSLLAAHLARHPSTDLVFTAGEGGPLAYSNFRYKMWLPALEHEDRRRIEADLEPLTPRPTFHDLRHTHVAWLIEAGVPLPAISRRLGHTSIQVTMDIYGGILPSVEDALVKGLAATHRRASADGLPMAASASSPLATVHAL
jgi:integrase